MKRTLTILLALVLMMAMAVPAMAAGEGSITIDNDNAKPLLETGDPCSCRNTWSLSVQGNDVKSYEEKIYE